MTIYEADELERLRREFQQSSLGDRPPSMAAEKLRRLIELERQESEERRQAVRSD